MKILVLILSTLAFNLYPVSSSAPQELKGLAVIDHLMSMDQVAEARTALDLQLEILKSDENYDSLGHYIYELGKIEMSENGSLETPETEELFELLLSRLTNPDSRYVVYFEMGEIEFEKGRINSAHELSEKARLEAIASKDLDRQATSEYKLGDSCLKMGDVTCLEEHIRKANSIVDSHKDLKFSESPRIRNLMGALMYFSSKPDSAKYFYNTGLAEIEGLPKTPENIYYYPAMIKGNMTLLLQNEGDFDGAAKLVEESVILNRGFLENTKNHPLTDRVKKNLSIAYSNLAAMYFNVGDYMNSDKICKMGYAFSKANLVPGVQEYTQAILSVADNELALRNFTEAKKYLEEAKGVLDESAEKNLASYAHMYNVYGMLYQQMERYQDARDAFKLSEEYYDRSYPGEYSWNRLNSAFNLALMYSRCEQYDQALAHAENLYAHFNASEDGNGYMNKLILECLSLVTYEQGAYDDCLKWTQLALDGYKSMSDSLGSTESQANYEMEKAKIILYHARSEYQLRPEKDVAFLESLLVEMTESMDVLENRKSLLSSVEGVNSLIADNLIIFDFVKQLYQELYSETGDIQYLHKLMSLHESGLYNKIRARLNLRQDIAFAGVPAEVLARENQLRNKLNQNFEEEEVSDFNSDRRAWRAFMDTLRDAYPKYHQMRFAGIERPIDDAIGNLAPNTSVIRYFFIEDAPFAYVLSSEGESLVELSYDRELDQIHVLNENSYDLEKSGAILRDLYEVLWRPLEDKLRGDHVVIIPDGELFNLSFESLLFEDIDSFKEMAEKSLLSQYFISYNYSLFLLSEKRGAKDLKKNMAAFAPEFNREMKDEYRSRSHDSLSFDRAYLRLVQQPFALALANEGASIFNGRSFVREQSTEKNFVENAGGNKIIYIGTHAESNNISPELSRFIFAKDTDDEDNSLYNYEIYSCDLTSQLAVLTACETGRPGYQPGEGMVSLAHAFNYAGSQSILTSLWKIDEQSSTITVKSFYEYLAKGMDKSEALTMAKRDYLSTAEGDQLAPAYWSGLVLIGDIAPISIERTAALSGTSWIVLGVLLLLGLIWAVARLVRRGRG